MRVELPKTSAVRGDPMVLRRPDANASVRFGLARAPATNCNRKGTGGGIGDTRARGASLYAGLHRRETLRLESSDVNIARRQIVIRRNVISKYVDTPKSGHGRVIDLSAELASSLEKHRKVTPSTTGRVMLQDTGRPAQAQHLYAWTRAAMDSAIPVAPPPACQPAPELRR